MGAQAAWAVLAGAWVVGGFAALGRLQPDSAVPTSSQLVLLASAAGMALGLGFDARAGGVATLAALCLSGPHDLAGILALHWEQLPRMHLGMVAGALVAVLLPLPGSEGRRRAGGTLARNLACSAWMVVGMGAGALAFAHLAGWTASRGGPVAMLGGMLAGMVWGMVAGAATAWLAARIPERPLAS